VIGQTAAREFEKALDDLDHHSAGGAARVLDAIDACVQRLSRFPESSPVDASAPTPLLQGATNGRRTHAEGFSIRYAFPVQIEDDVEVVLILSIRHGKRRPLGDREYLRRFLAELVRGRSG
jgi:plasmid stabilization system protein ParE